MIEKIKEYIINKLEERGYLPDEAEKAIPDDEMLKLIIEAIVKTFI